MGRARQMSEETLRHLKTLPRSKRLCLRNLEQADVAMAIDQLADRGIRPGVPRYRRELGYLVWCPDSVRLHFAAFLWHTTDTGYGYADRPVTRWVYHEPTLRSIVAIIGLGASQYVRRLKVSRQVWVREWEGRGIDAPMVSDPLALGASNNVCFAPCA